MVSGGACSLARSFARRLGAAAAPNPETRYKKPAGRSAPVRPRARELKRAGGARAGSPARGGGRGRSPGALAPVAHLARRRRRRHPGGGGRPGPGGGAAGSPRRGAQLPGGGLRAGPRSHFVLCKSHESGFPRAGAAMPAAEGRARAPLCRHRAGRRRLRLLPARPGRRSAGPRALARAGPPSLPPSLAGWLAGSLAPRLPGPAPSSLRSLQSASRLNLALWAAWSEGSGRGGKMGASARRKRRRRPRALVLRRPPPVPLCPDPGSGARARECSGPGPGPGQRLPVQYGQLVFVLRREPSFLFSARGARGIRCWRCGFSSSH